MTVIDPNDVLALLEPGPQPFGQLQAWLGNPKTADLGQVLARMADAGQVKRFGKPRQWALGNFSAPIGRPRKPQSLGRAPRPMTSPRPKAPTSATGAGSWWTTPAVQADRSAFHAAQAAAHDAMRLSKFGRPTAHLNTISGTDERGLRAELRARRQADAR